jgi:thioredoxin-related protein
LISLFTNAQTENISIPPYKRFPSPPPFQLLLGDSVTRYTKANLPKKPLLLLIYSPDCTHCQHTAEEIIASKEDLKNIQIVMATISSIRDMNAFQKKYKLDKMSNVVAGKDIYFLLPPFYGMKNFPYLALYDKKGKLILGFEGSMSIKKVVEAFRSNQ